jgi:hypothetical protein
MTARIEATINSLAALLVLFTAMLDPWVSAGLAVAFLFALAFLKLLYERKSSVGT